MGIFGRTEHKGGKRRRLPLLLSPCLYSIHPLANARLWGKEGIRRKEGGGREGGRESDSSRFVRSSVENG